MAERKVQIQIDMLGRSGVIEAVYVEHMGLGLHRVKVQPWQKKLFEAIGHEVHHGDTVHLWMNQFHMIRGEK